VEKVDRYKMQNALRSFEDHHKLIAMIHTMAQELKRLEEDNLQLRCAVAMFRDVARRKQKAKAAR
jgi:hypothetical protein